MTVEKRDWSEAAMRDVAALLKLPAEVARLRAAVLEHYGQSGDDKCWQDDDRLYAAFGLPPKDHSVGDKAAMLANCERYVERSCVAGGPWKSYRELEAENAALKAEVARLAVLLTTARHEFDGDVPPHSALAQGENGDCH